MPSVMMEAEKVASYRRVYQHNQADLDFLKRVASACRESKCDQYSLEQMYKEMEELYYSMMELKREIERATQSLTEVLEKDGKLYGQLSKTSKARHDIAMNAIRNMKA